MPPISLLAQGTTPLYGPSGVTPAAVRQGILGSCYFHASIAAVAQANPSAIRGALTGTRQTGYRVRFTTGAEELVYAQDVEYARAHNYDHSDGEWVTVLMRGYAQRELRKSLIEGVTRSTTLPTFLKPAALTLLRQSGPLLVGYDRAIRSVVNQDGQMDRGSFRSHLSTEFSTLGIPAAQAALLLGLIDHAGVYESLSKTVQANGEVFGAYRGMGQGGIPTSVISALMGGARSEQVSEETTLLATLRNLHGGGRAMVAGTKSSGLDASNANWFVPDHAYTVLDFDDASGSVQLRNPWAGKPRPDGVFRISLPIFERNYLGFSFSNSSAK